MPPLVVHQSPLLASIEGLAHGFLARHGGVSSSPFSSLNLGTNVGDHPRAVVHNRARALHAVGRPRSVWKSAQQVHGAEVVEVTRNAGMGIKADGLITRDARVVVAVTVADCVPLLLSSADGRVVGAVHAGWRGTAAGVAAVAVARFNGLGVASEQLRVAMGPCIGRCCFSVGADVVDALRATFPGEREALPNIGLLPPGAAPVAHRAGEVTHIDLRYLNRVTLERAGVPRESISEDRRCTFCDDSFFSHRRDVVTSVSATGRQAALIARVR